MHAEEKIANTLDTLSINECADRKLDARCAQTIGVGQAIQILRQLLSIRDAAMYAGIKIAPRDHVFCLEQVYEQIPWQAEFAFIHSAYKVLVIRETDPGRLDQMQARNGL